MAFHIKLLHYSLKFLFLLHAAPQSRTGNKINQINKKKFKNAFYFQEAEVKRLLEKEIQEKLKNLDTPTIVLDNPTSVTNAGGEGR